MNRNLKVKEAATLAQVSESLIYEWCKAGVLRHSRFGRPGSRGTIRIADVDLQAFLAACQRQGQGETVPAPPLRHIMLPQLS